MWSVGQKLVCIRPEGSFWQNPGNRELIPGPKKDEIVTYDGPDGHRSGLGILLKEYNPLRYADGALMGFHKDYFRPLVERKNETDITVFKKLLTTTKSPELV